MNPFIAMMMSAYVTKTPSIGLLDMNIIIIYNNHIIIIYLINWIVGAAMLFVKI